MSNELVVISRSDLASLIKNAVQEVFKEWDDKFILWSAGIEQPTKADKLLFDILRDYTCLKEK